MTDRFAICKDGSSPEESSPHGGDGGDNNYASGWRVDTEDLPKPNNDEKPDEVIESGSDIDNPFITGDDGSNEEGEEGEESDER